ncbi:MAG: hypothetical protein IJY70_03925 [Clostridia bacterium]|nr:hypothetical protein [Clostridia bacterium]
MKIWVLAIFRLAPKASRIIKSIENRVEKIALDAFGITSEQYERIINLNDEKRKIINLAILKRAVEKSVKPRDLDALNRYAFGQSADEISQNSGVGGSAIRKRINRAIIACTEEMEKLGYGASKLEREYSDIPALINAKRFIERKIRINKRKRL